MTTSLPQSMASSRVYGFHRGRKGKSALLQGMYHFHTFFLFLVALFRLSRLAFAEPHRPSQFGSFFIDSVDPRTCFSSFSYYLAMFTPFEPCFAFSFTLSLFFLKLTSKTNSKSVYKVKHTFDHFYWCASLTSLPLIYSFYFGF